MQRAILTAPARERSDMRQRPVEPRPIRSRTLRRPWTRCISALLFAMVPVSLLLTRSAAPTFSAAPSREIRAGTAIGGQGEVSMVGLSGPAASTARSERTALQISSKQKEAMKRDAQQKKMAAIEKNKKVNENVIEMD